MSYGLEGSEQLSHLASAFWVLLYKAFCNTPGTRVASPTRRTMMHSTWSLPGDSVLWLAEASFFFPARFHDQYVFRNEIRESILVDSIQCDGLPG